MKEPIFGNDSTGDKYPGWIVFQEIGFYKTEIKYCLNEEVVSE